MDKPIINLDMDGVVADFNSYAESILNKKVGWGKYDLTNDDWKELQKVQDLYLRLPFIRESKRLVDVAISYEPEWYVRFLTAIPRVVTMPSAESDKKAWIFKHFGRFDVVIGPYSKDKQNWAKSGDILIDDKPSNIREWKAKGGVGILHSGDFDSTISQLREAVENYNEEFFN